MCALYLENLSEKLKLTTLHAPAAVAAGAANGTAINSRSIAARLDNASAVTSVGATTGTPTSYTVTVQLQDSPDGTTYTNVTDKVAVYTAAGVYALDYCPSKYEQYRRIVKTVAFVSGSSPTVQVGILEIGADATQYPIA